MSFWTDSNIKINQKYRFQLDIGGLVWWVKSIKLPSFSAAIKEVSEGAGGPREYSQDPPVVEAISITLPDIMIPKGTYSSYETSTGSWWFWLFKLLESTTQGTVVQITPEGGDVDVVYPIEEQWALTNLNAQMDENGKLNIANGKIKQIKITKFYGDNKKEVVSVFQSVIKKLDLGNGDYSSDELNEIVIDLQPTGFVVETIKDGEPVETEQNITKTSGGGSSSTSEDNSSRPSSASKTPTKRKCRRGYTWSKAQKRCVRSR